MKGPANRLKFRIRRLWECPHCHRRVFTAGHVVQQPCHCRPTSDTEPATWMQLIEDPAVPAPRNTQP